MVYSAAGKAGKKYDSLADKKGMKKIGAREVVQCSNDNCFLDLDVDIALSGRPVGYCTVGEVLIIATNKRNKIPCN